MKAKKFLAGALAAITALACCLFTGCRNLSNTAPKVYGEWDGNYIYCGNMRSKTTGEEEEILVKSFERNGVAYDVRETRDVEYVGDYVYLCVYASETNTQGENGISCLARYDIKEKKSEVIYFETDGYGTEEIYKVSDSFIILRNGRKVFRIDYSGNIIGTEEEYLYDYVMVGKDYLVAFEDGKLSYRTWEDETMYEMFYTSSVESGSRYCRINYVEQSGQKGFLITVYYNSNWRGLWFYDVVNNETTELIQEDKVCAVQEDYVVSGTRWEMHFGMTDCHLYKIKIEEIGVSIEKVYDFSKKKNGLDFTDFIVAVDGNLYFRAYSGSARDYENYTLNPKTKTLKRSSTSVANIKNGSEWLMKTTGVSYDGYIYYVDSELYDNNKWYLYWDNSYADVLYRYNTQSGKTEIMQFRANQEDMKEATNIKFRYSDEFFQKYDYYEGPQFVVRDY